MKRRFMIVLLVLVMVGLISVPVIAGGAKHGTYVYFEIQKMIAPDVYADYFVPCEGYFMETGSGIVHEWRDNEECMAYPEAFIPSASLHLVFKPQSNFSGPDCDDEAQLYWSGEWTLDPVTYGDLDLANQNDDANLTDVLGIPGEDMWWVCIYEWE